MASENVVMNLTANADFSNLVTSVNRVTASLLKMQEQIGASNRILTGQIAATNKAFSETLRQTGQFGTHFVTLADDVTKFGNHLDKGQLKLRDYYGAWQQHAKTSGGLIRQLAQQQVQLQNAVLQPLGKNAQGLMQFNVQVPKGLDLVKNKVALTTQELKIMNKVMQEGANQMINWGKNTQWAGRQLTVGLTVPIAAFGLAASKAFREADQELVRLTKVYGGVAATSAAELGKIRKEVSLTAATLAKEYGASYKETIGLAADLAATGKQGNDLLKATSETTRLMVLGEVDRQDAMKATLTIQNTFKQNTKELAESVNFLNAVENQTSLTIQDLTEAIPKAGPVVKALGGDVKDLALYLTAMKEGGIGAAEGANALKSAFASMINPTKVATEQFRSFGIDLQGMVKKNTGNTTQMLLDLQSALDKLDPLSKSKAIEQLFGKFQFARMSALIENLGKQGSQSLQVLDLLKQSTGDIAAIADRELKQVTESASGKYKRAVEGLKADLAGIGDEFLKIQTFFINVTDKIVKFINILPGPIKSILTFLTGLTAIAGPLIMLTGVMANFIGYVIKGAFHFKSLFKSGEGWRMLTPEILAAQKAGSLIEKTFYSDAKAALSLAEALQVLESSYIRLNGVMNAGAVPVNPTVSTIAGSTIVAGAGAIPRVVDPNNPLVGQQGTRASAHINPLRGRTQEQIASSTIFGFVPGAIPVNNALKDAPQMYANGDLPNIPGLTTASSKHGPVSTGIVAAEATKWQTLMGTMSMMSKTEVAAMKKEIQATGAVSSEFMTAYSSLLPEITKISEKAVMDSAAIVSQVKSGEMQLATAKERLIQLNYEIERAMGVATTGVATSLGRTANLTSVPGIDQPIIDPKGKSNMRQLFGKGNASWVDKLAGAFGVKTWGASYSTHTTRPKRLNSGGRVYDPSRDGNIVPGDTSINYDNTPAKLQAGGFVLNQDASKNNPDLVQLATNGYESGGPIVPALLTPGETYFPPALANQIMPTLESANGGTKVQLRALGGLITPTRSNYGRLNLSAGSLRGSARDVLGIFGLHSPKMEFGPAGEKLGRFNKSTGLRAKILSLVAKPATGLYGKIPADMKMPINPKTKRPHTLESLNELMAGQGLSGENLKAYLLTLRAAEQNGAVHGSTSQFLYSIPEELLSRKDAIRIAQEIDVAYMQAVAGMERLTDSNNPYHSISKSAVLAQSNMNLGKMWSEYSRQLSGLNPLYESDLASGRGHSNSAGARVIKVTDPRDPLGKKKIKIGKLSGSNADNSMFFHSANSDWENYYGLNQFTQPVAANMGGLIGGRVFRGKNNYGLKLPASVIERLTARWPGKKQFYPQGHQYMLGNQDPLHGPLQIGMSNNLNRFSGANDLSRRQEVVFKDDRFSRLNIMPAFLTGTAENRGRYATSQYMSGNLDIMSQMERLGNHPLGPIAAMKTLQKKFTGKLYRGLILGKTHNSLPEKLIEDIRIARATGDYSNLIGQEFIMRRSSWSKNKIVGSAFAPGHGVNADSILLEASVRNRNILPAGDMFPEKVFQAPYGQSWNKTRFGSGAMSEQEAIFGGKFKIVGFDNGKMQVETVVDAARENGGPVNSGRPYLVGENGPELFVPKNAGGIVPNYALGGKVKSGKTGYGNPMGITGAFLAKGLAANIAFMLAPQLLSKMGAPKGLTDNIFPAMIAGQMALGGRAVYKKAKAAEGAGVLAGDAVKAESALARLSPRFLQLAGVASKAAGPIGLVVTGLQIYSMLEKNHKHNQEVLANSFGLSAKAAKEAGVQIRNLDDVLKSASDTAKSGKVRAALSFANDQSNVKGIALTVKQLKDMEASVKKTMPFYVESFKKMTGRDIADGAVRIKSQWVAMGMNVEQANAKIYTLIKLTHGQAAATSVMNNTAFQSIVDKATAAKESITSLAYAIKHVNNLGASGVANSYKTFIQTQTDTFNSLLNTAKDKNSQNPYSDAFKGLMGQYQRGGLNNLKLPEGMIPELAKTDPILASIINKTDTIASAMSKWLIATSGTVENLSLIANLSQKEANIVALAVLDIQQASEKALAADKVIGPIEKNIKNMQDALLKSSKASVGMSVIDQVAAKKKIKSLEDQIKLINEEAAARKKSLEQQIASEDTLNQIKKKQLDYQQALAAGDTVAAAQAQLDIQQLTSTRQVEMAKNSIDINAAGKIAPLQAQADKLNAAISASADAQAVAAASMNDLAKSLSDYQTKDAALKQALNQALQDDQLTGGATKVDLRNLADAYAALAGLSKKGNQWIGTDGKPIDEKALFESLKNQATNSMSVSAKEVIIQAGKLTQGGLGTGSGGTGDKAPKYDPKAAAGGTKGGGTPPVAIRPGTTVSEIFVNPDPKHPEFRKPGYQIPNSFVVSKYAYKSVDSLGNSITFNAHGEVINNATGLQEGVWFGIQGLQKTNTVFPTPSGMALGGIVNKYDTGGGVSGPGTGTSDSIPAYLSNGEYVVRAAAVNQYGKDFFDGLNAQKLHKGGAIGHKHLSPGHMASNYDSKSWLKKTGNFLSEMVKETGRSFDWLTGMYTAGQTGTMSPKMFSKNNQALLNDIKATNAAGNSSEANKAMAIKTGLSGINVASLLLGGAYGAATLRGTVGAYGISKGIPGLETLLPTGSLSYGAKIAAGGATNLGTAAVIGAAKPFNQHLTESILPKPTISQSIAEQKIGSTALTSSNNVINNAINKTRSADETSVQWLNSIYALAEQIGAKNGRRVPSFTGDRSLYSAAPYRKSQFTMLENLDDKTDNILNWPWSSSKKDITSGGQFSDPVIEKLTSRQKRAIAKVTNTRYNSSKSFSISNEEFRNGYKQYYIDHPEGDWDFYLNKEMGKVGLREPLPRKFAGYTEDPAAFLETKKGMFLTGKDERVTFNKFVTGPVRKKPEFGEAYGNYNSHVTDSPLFAPGDYSEALRNKFEKVYKDLIKSGYIQKAEFINGKRVAQKSKTPLPDEHYTARDSLHQSTSPRGKSYTLNEFLQLLAGSVPDAMTSSKQAGSALNYLDRPTDFVRTVNESLAKQMGLTSGDKLTFWKYDLYGTPLKNDKGAPVAAGYYSLDKGMAYSYPRQRGDITQQHLDDPNSSPGFGSGEQGQTRGGYKMELYPHEVPQVIGFGGMADELAIVVGETLAKEKSVWQGPAKASEWQYSVDADAIRGLSFLKMYKPGKWEVNGEGKFDITPDQLDEAALAINSGKFKTTVKNEDYRGKDLGPWTGESIKAKLWSIAELIQKDGKNRSLSLEAIPAYHVENSHQGLDNILQVQELYNLIRTNVQKLKPITMLDKKFNNNLSISSMMPPLKIGNNASYSPTLKIPKFENGINSVPVDMLAQLHKNEAVVPANMNPFNPNANNATMSGTVYNVGNVTMQFAEAPANGRALFAEFKEAIRIDNAKVGGIKEFGSKVMSS
jgi:TP901 family phage tail tape measure protein